MTAVLGSDVAIDVDLLSHDARLAALGELARVRDRAEAAQHRLLAACSADDPSRQGWIVDEIACVLTIPPSTAEARLREAHDLAVRLPATAAAMYDGLITPRHAAVVQDLTVGLDPAVQEAVEARVLDKATGRTTAEFRRTVRRAIAALDRRTVEERHADHLADRRVTVRPVSDGMSEVWALLPADGAARLMAAITAAAADADVEDPRTLDQRRADALVDLADPSGDRHGGPQPPLGEHEATAEGSSDAQPARPARPAGPSVQVTVDLDTLLGLDDLPAELAGHGPIPAPMARRIAADPSASWRRFVTDRCGATRRVVDAELTYRPSARLRALIVGRDVTCRFPGCSRPARRAEIDHILAWEDGGPTAADNLQALCSRHHHLKHEAGWSVERDIGGGVTWWRSPTGRIFHKPPDDVVADYVDPPRADELQPFDAA